MNKSIKTYDFYGQSVGLSTNLIVTPQLSRSATTEISEFIKSFNYKIKENLSIS